MGLATAQGCEVHNLFFVVSATVTSVDARLEITLLRDDDQGCRLERLSDYESNIETASVKMKLSIIILVNCPGFRCSVTFSGSPPAEA